MRIARDRNKQKIAFIDYKSEEDAKIAMNLTRGFRLPNTNKGISKYSSSNILVYFVFII